jgi:hypothetical protein
MVEERSKAEVAAVGKKVEANKNGIGDMKAKHGCFVKSSIAKQWESRLAKNVSEYQVARQVAVKLEREMAERQKIKT